MRKKSVKARHKNTSDYIVVTGAGVPSFQVREHILIGVDPGIQKSDSKRGQRVVIPKTVDRIQNKAFSNRNGLKKVRFSQKAFFLDAGVFSGCVGLETVTLAPGTYKIPMEAFCGCSSLHTVSLPDSIQRINLNGFKNCTSMKNIRLPASLNVIEDAAFYGCHALEEICLPEQMTALGADAFANCTALGLVHLSDSLKSIGECAFMNCQNLKEIVIPPAVKELPIGAFAGCKNLKRVVLPEALTSISEYSFYGCCSLESVEGKNPEQFARAWEGTPFWQNRYPNARTAPKLPMALLNLFAGKVSGVLLSALGYPQFDGEKEYRIFQTEQAGVFKVWTEPEGKVSLMNDALEPVPRGGLAYASES